LSKTTGHRPVEVHCLKTHRKKQSRADKGIINHIGACCTETGWGFFKAKEELTGKLWIN